jgi:hypothetical protein
MRDTKFSARFSRQDQDLLVHLAACMQRTKSDTVRILIQEKAAELGLIPTPCSQQNHRGNRYH